jgi:flagellar basal-body rod protein FlgB
MSISDIPIFSMLRTKMQWHQERQRLLAENVANAETPRFRPRDLVAPKFDDAMTANGTTLTMTRSDPNHVSLAGFTAGAQFEAERKAPYQVRSTGNAVSVEDEMLKVAANQMDYQAVTSLYSRSLGLLKSALGKR